MTAAVVMSFEESNAGKKDLIRRWVLSNIDYSGLERGQPVCFKGRISFYHIELPDDPALSPVLLTRVLRLLVDEDVKEDLERAGLINWCPNTRRMIPLSVPRDGNCLMHSLATAMWGIGDGDLMMRRVLGLVLSVDCERRFYSRWRHYQQGQLTHLVDNPAASNPEHLAREWNEITQCLDADQSRPRAAPHRFLEAIHVYAMANVLRRPVVVVTDPTLRTFSGLSLQDNDMGGIYLPLEWKWQDTWRTPVILAYTHCHFSPLVLDPRAPADRRGASLVPLVNRNLQQLPLRFLLPGEGPEVLELLSRYLKVKETVMQLDGRLQNILCAQLEALPLPDEVSLVKDYFHLCRQQFQLEAASFSRPLPPYQTGMPSGTSGGTYQPWGHFGAPGQNPASPQGRQQVQRVASNEYSLADPTLNNSWGGESQVHIPPPSFTPRVSLLEQNASLRTPLEQQCVVPGCRYCGDPELGRMCSRCFRNYSIKESRQMAAGGAVRPVPSAPLPSMQEEEQRLQTSMMTERCRAGCGFRCSVQTYPYCHECSEKLKRINQPVAVVRPSEALVPSVTGVPSAGLNSATVPSPGLPQGGSGVPIVSPLNDLNRPQGMPSAAGPPLTPQKVLGTSQIAETSSGQKSNESESPTRILETGSLLAPLTPPDDPNDRLLFGSGQPSPPSETQPGGALPQSPKPATSSQLMGPADPWTAQQVNRIGQNDLRTQVSSPHSPEPRPAPLAAGQHPEASLSHLKESHVAVPGTAGEARGKECVKEGCPEKAVYKNLCVKCYVGKDMRPSPPDNPAMHRLKMQSLCSTSSSAPAAVGPAGVMATPSSPCLTVAEPLQGRPKASSLDCLLEPSRSPHHYVQAWVNTSGGQLPAAERPSAPGSQPLGLPEKQETEPLGNDLIVSGAECSSPPRCIGDGCRNSVEKEGALCEQCKAILRRFRQGQAPSVTSLPGGGSQPEQRRCQTEGCPYSGIRENFYFCSACHSRLLQRQMEEELRHVNPASSAPLFPTNSVPASPSRALPVVQQQQGRLCSVPGCSLFGDPKQADRCSSHYQQYLNRFAAPVGNGPGARLPEHGDIPMQTASLGNQHERHQRHPLQVAEPPSEGAPLVTAQRGRTNSATQTSSRYPGPAPCDPPSAVTGVGSSAPSGQELSLGTTYNRLVARDAVKCLNPACTNYGNPRKGGVCNSCAEDEGLAHVLIYGEEAIG